MLFTKTSNTLILNSYIILTEVCIGFITFSVFFYLFMTYIFTNYEVDLLSNFIKDSISYYNITQNDVQKQLLKSLIENSKEKKELELTVSADGDKVIKYNVYYDNRLLVYVMVFIVILLLILILPVILGIISLDQISFKYICTSLLLHIVLIVGLEMLFLLFITKYINPVKLYLLFQENKDKTGTYI